MTGYNPAAFSKAEVTFRLMSEEQSTRGNNENPAILTNAGAVFTKFQEIRK